MSEAEECKAHARITPPPMTEFDSELFCMLPKDHDGQHYDATDDITWKVGKPDE